MQETLVMTEQNPNSKIIASKEKLAADVLEVAQDALEDIKVCMSEASVKDLIQIFNSAVTVSYTHLTLPTNREV